MTKHVPHPDQPSLFASEPVKILDGRSDLERRNRNHPTRLETVQLGKQGLKRCKACKVVKPFSDFHKSRTSHGGVLNVCKECDNERARHSFHQRLYGLSREAYLALFETQQSLCAICGIAGESPDTIIRTGRRGQSGVLHVDHDHKIGVVRGLLCNACNSAIGLLREDPDILNRARDYLLKHRYTE